MTYSAELARADRVAWEPADLVSVSQWAEAHRVLSDRVSSEPGPYRMSRVPYLREIHDTMGDDTIREVVVGAPAQSGKSEMGRNWLGWCCDLQPGPVLIVFPSEASAKENMVERVIPMFSDTPHLARLKTGRAWDLKRGQVTLTTCTMYVGWAGSPQALASRPIRYCLLDEVDKFKRYAGREADPVSLARVRLRTYGNRAKLLLISTPTIPTGTIWRSLQACPDRRIFHVPCPRCGEYAELRWDQVRWDGMEESEADALHRQLSQIAAGLLSATYECDSCHALIPDVERRSMVDAGEWVSEGYPRGERPPSASVGYRIPGLCSPWTTLTDLVREWLSARLKGLGELQYFFNSMLGLPFWGADKDGNALEITPEEIYAKGEAGHEPGVVPTWATILVAATDTGYRSFQWVVRAFGRGYRSRLIAYGECATFSELREATLDRRFPVEGGAPAVWPQILCIDSGGGGANRDSSRTEEVYRFALTEPARIKPLKGYGGAGLPLRPVSTNQHQYRPHGGKDPLDVTLSIVDTGYFKDLIAARIQHEDPSVWETMRTIGRDYVMQLSSERRTLIERRVRPDGEAREVWRWVPRATGAANHYWDAEVYAAVGAYMLEADREEPTWPGTAAPQAHIDDDAESGWDSYGRGGVGWSW